MSESSQDSEQSNESSQASREDFPLGSFEAQDDDRNDLNDSQNSEMESSFTEEEKDRLLMPPVVEGELADDELLFPIPKNVPSVNEMQQCVQALYQPSSCRKDRKFFIKMLYDLLCGIACDSVTSEEDPNKIYVVYNLVAINLTDLLENTLIKKAYFRDHLLAYLPDGKVPDELLTFIQTIRATQPAASFWDKNKKLCNNMSEDARALCYFGFKIWERHQSGKRYVNSQCNPHWKVKVLEKSGNNDSAVFLGIRQHLWQSELQSKAELSVINKIRNQTKRVAKDMKVRDNIIDVEQKKHLVEEIVTSQMLEGFNQSHYPSQWLLFVLVGAPAGEMALGSYNSGTGKRKFDIASVASFRDELGSKASRRRLDKSVKDAKDGDDTATKSSSSITSTDKCVTVKFAVKIFSTEEQLEKQISIANRQLELLGKQINLSDSVELTQVLKGKSSEVMTRLQILLTELEHATVV
jgi:hypothetical protein